MSDHGRAGRFYLRKAKTRKTERSPTHTGSINIQGTWYWLSAWVETGEDGSKYFSGRVGDVKGEQGQRPAQQPEISREITGLTSAPAQTQTASRPVPDYDDDIPF